MNDDLPIALFFASVEELSAPREARIRALMSAEERAREERFRHEPSRLCFLITRELVRTTLTALGGRTPEEWRFAQNEKGRPSLVNPTGEIEHLDFNLAHSHAKIALAVVDRGRVGVDIEPVTRRVDHDVVARRFFSDHEQKELEKLGGEARRRRFLELWVLKEAWLKADGRGISAGLHRVIFDFDEGAPRLRSLPDDDPRCWQIGLQEVEGHLLGLAYRSN